MPNRRHTDPPAGPEKGRPSTHAPTGLRSSNGNLKVVGDAASAGPGTGNDTEDGGDWMAERITGPEDLPADETGAAAGVPVSTRSPQGTRRGKAIESKRGQQ
ncbi:MAG: hypothetical protein ABIN96_16415 [Rubrivivax sp.]